LANNANIWLNAEQTLPHSESLFLRASCVRAARRHTNRAAQPHRTTNLVARKDGTVAAKLHERDVGRHLGATGFGKSAGGGGWVKLRSSSPGVASSPRVAEESFAKTPFVNENISTAIANGRPVSGG
jgi:hypothetical protein